MVAGTHRCYISPGPLRRGDTGRGLLAGDAIDPRQKQISLSDMIKDESHTVKINFKKS